MRFNCDAVVLNPSGGWHRNQPPDGNKTWEEVGGPPRRCMRSGFYVRDGRVCCRQHYLEAGEVVWGCANRFVAYHATMAARP
jgi:hypothetical protein